MLEASRRLSYVYGSIKIAPTIIKNRLNPFYMLLFARQSVYSFYIETIQIYSLNALVDNDGDSGIVTSKKSLKWHTENRP
jgi:hypothetical protein